MSGHKVLIVDDHPDIVFMLARFFRKKFECDVTTAFSVDQAEQFLKTNSFCIIISDFEMPIRNGVELVNVLKQEDAQVPLLFYTGRDEPTRFWNALDYPCAVVRKPNHQELLAVAKHFLIAD